MQQRVASFFGLSGSGFHKVVYRESGPADATRTVLCVHGLTRNSRDFDDLAAALATDGYRVVCPDVVGRGDSEYLRDPSGYGYPQYLADMAALIARLGVDSVDWVGTSMGGLIGMMLAAQPGNPLRTLVMNDVGPFIPKAELDRILEYLGADPRFKSLEAAERYCRETYAQFGALSAAQWQHMAENFTRRDGESYRLAYDPAIAAPFQGIELTDVDLWPLWDMVPCPALILRGADSALLPAETAVEMTRRGPKCDLEVIPGCGHAPSLMEPSQVRLVVDWLNNN